MTFGSIEAVAGIDTDYLLIGAGAAGLPFADALIADSDAGIVMAGRVTGTTRTHSCASTDPLRSTALTRGSWTATRSTRSARTRASTNGRQRRRSAITTSGCSMSTCCRRARFASSAYPAASAKGRPAGSQPTHLARTHLSNFLPLEPTSRKYGDTAPMRRVGRELGTRAASLYGHAATPDDLLDLIEVPSAVRPRRGQRQTDSPICPPSPRGACLHGALQGGWRPW